MYLQLNKGDRTEWDDPELVDRYLSMYVSGLTLDMGDRGREAIKLFLRRGADVGLCPRVEKLLVL
jgi:predicted solute-binding protein